MCSSARHYHFLDMSSIRYRSTLGRNDMKSTRRVLGHSLLRSLVRPHRSLIRLLRTARFAHALRCAHSFARSLTHSFPGSWESCSCLWNERVDFIQFQSTVNCIVSITEEILRSFPWQRRKWISITVDDGNKNLGKTFSGKGINDMNGSTSENRRMMKMDRRLIFWWLKNWW